MSEGKFTELLTVFWEVPFRIKLRLIVVLPLLILGGGVYEFGDFISDLGRGLSRKMHNWLNQ